MHRGNALLLVTDKMENYQHEATNQHRICRSYFISYS